jgi:hypothetical protein
VKRLSFPRYPDRDGFGRYILVGHEVVAEPNWVAWADWMETADRRVARDMVGPLLVSTVFLAIDHRHFGEGPPILFETMVFADFPSEELHCRRCSTWAEAERQHRVALRWARLRLRTVPEWEPA